MPDGEMAVMVSASRARNSCKPGRIAYLTGRYPEVSLTFILREVEALRALGVDVVTCSLQKTPPEQHPGLLEKTAAANTFNVQESAKNPLVLLAAQRYVLTQTGRYFDALRLAWKTRAPGLRAALYQLVYFVEATVLARHLEREGVTHLHNHFVFGSATVAMLAAHLVRIPFSFTLHGPADLFEPYRWALDEKTTRAAFVATISNYARSQLMFFSDPGDWHKIRIIHCGVEPARYETPDVPEASVPEAGALQLLFVGRVAPVKGLRVLLKGIEKLRDEFPGLRLTLVGDGPDRAEIEAAAAPLGDHVHFTGYLSQEDVSRAMHACDIFVLPSFAEGVPVVLMEAMASGRPVVATQVAGVGELVQDGENGLLVLPGDVESLVEAIRTLAHDPDRRRRMGEAGRARVGADFDSMIEAARLVTLFTQEAGDAVRPEPHTRDAQS